MDITQAAGIMLITVSVIFIFMVLVWLLSLRLRNASIADVFWGTGFILVAWTAFTVTPCTTCRGMLAAVLTTMWGLRLSLHIFSRNRGRPEDPRYVRMREKHGSRFRIVSLFTVFLFQGLMMFIISLPVQAAIAGQCPDYITALDVLGSIVWAAGFFFESVGDYQLTGFLADPANRGKVMDRGLWRYTRHPNYFGEAVMWWGLFIIALSVRYGAYTAAGPLLITFLLLRVSGVTMLEKDMKESNPEYADYIERTSSFIPRPPAKPGR